MSKDKGTKNIKKPPADKSAKGKNLSDYKSESRSGSGIKTDNKSGGNKKA